MNPRLFLSALLLAALPAAPLHAQQNARPGSNARGTTGTTTRGTGGGGVGGGGNSGGRSSGGSQQYRRNTELGDAVITIDPETRSLVIVTDEDTHREMTGVIKQLDQPKPQVLIKVVFLEVTYNKGLDVGIEGSYTFNLKNPVAATTGTSTATSAATATTGTAPNTTTNAVNSSLVTNIGTAANVGRTATLQNLFGLSTLTQGSFVRLASDDWSATLHALASKGKVEVLSRPSIMARNNQEAVIVVGSEVPFITASSLTSTGQTNNTIKYDNVGIILRVTPFITSEGTVEMIVAPEISALTDQTVPIGNNISAPVISKRSAETVVVTPHAQTVVIGGLMQTQKTSSVQKIPLLGDIPYLGGLFRSESRSRKRTNLMVFLRPVVMRDQSNSNRISLDRYDYIRGQQLEAQPPPSSILRINDSPVLPQIRPDALGPTGAPRPLGDTSQPPPPMAPSIPASGPQPTPPVKN